MNYPFMQPKVIYGLNFNTTYKTLGLFENYFAESSLGMTCSEVYSTTIDSHGDDLWSIEVLFEQKPNLEQMKFDLTNYARENNIRFDSEIVLKTIEDKDWVKEYQAQLKPIIIDRFFITSNAVDEKCPADKIPIYIEASRAFGTGDHATTSLCIEAMNKIHGETIKDIFDIGTGSGILSFVAEKIWTKASILACDIEEISINIAKNNQMYNNSNVEFFRNKESISIPETYNSRSFDLIVSNILAPILIELIGTIKNFVKTNSYIIISGFLDYQAQEIITAYENAGFRLVERLDKNNWSAITFKVTL